MTACRRKSHWLHVSDVMRAAERMEAKHGYVFEWYVCDECMQYHLRTRKHDGIKVLSLDAIKKAR